MAKFELIAPIKKSTVASEHSVPAMPASSGSAWPWDSPIATLKKDRAYVDEHADFLRSRAAQASAMTQLVDRRYELALAIARLGALQEIADHEYRMGRADRDHARKMQALTHASVELHREMELLAARQQYERLNTPPPPPQSPPASPPPPPPGLAVEDVELVAAAMPELAEGGTLETLIRALRGRLMEKRS